MNGDKVNVIDELKPLEFEQAVKYFGDKVPMRPAEFKQLLDAVKSKAFISQRDADGVHARYF